MKEKQRYDISVRTPNGPMDLNVKWDGYLGLKDNTTGYTNIHTANFIDDQGKITLQGGGTMPWMMFVGDNHYPVLNIDEVQQQLTGDGELWQFVYSKYQAIPSEL